MIARFRRFVSSKVSGIAKVYRDSLWVKTHAGINLKQQYKELFLLKSNGLSPTDYYKYGLFDNDRFPSMEIKKTYQSYKQKDEFRHFSDPKIWAIAYHKHILYRLLDTFGFPVPTIYALYSPRDDGFERHRSLTTKEELIDFLSTTNQFPIFGKPSNASHGYGALALMGRNAKGQLVMHNDEISELGAIADRIHNIAMRTGTYILSEKLRPCLQLRELSGETLPSLRMVTFVNNGEPELFRAGILVPRFENLISNFQDSKTGNIGTGIEIETGTIYAALNRAGPDFNWVEIHPDTGLPIVGLKLDYWEDTVALVMEASKACSPFRMQHWDVGITDRGPVLLELNFIGDIEPMQLFGPEGVKNKQYMDFSRNNRLW